MSWKLNISNLNSKLNKFTKYKILGDDKYLLVIVILLRKIKYLFKHLYKLRKK